jgi:hypothetical protein
MSDETVSVTYTGPCAEVITRRGRLYVQGEAQDVPRDEAERLSGDFEIDGVAIELVVTEKRSTAPARKLAAEHEIDIDNIEPSDGVTVSKPDVQKVIDAAAAAEAEAEGVSA